MLLQFTFENYKSFKDETTLDMTASSIKEHESDVAIDASGERVLKVATIFGANASGKSNVFKAFEFMVYYVKESFSQKDQRKLNVEPFAFARSLKGTSFDVLFSVGEDVFQYGFALDNQHVVEEEYLYKRETNTKREKFKTLFYRNKSSIEELSMDFEQLRGLLEILDKTVLFISTVAKFNISIIQKVISWFENIATVNYAQSFDEERPFLETYSGTPLINILKDNGRKKKLENFVKYIDLGIKGLTLISLGAMNTSLFDDKKEELYLIWTEHDAEGGSEFLTIEHESSGTRKLIALYVYLEQVLESGGVLFADELDAKLHPLLLRYLINMFHDPATNPKNAQLIFTTHDVFTLDKDNFRRDEIWFVDKDERGVSELYSLAEYKQENGMKTRNDASYGKDYILGKYNAIPNLKRLTEESVQDGE